MQETKQITREQLDELMAELPGDGLLIIDGWLDRGDGVAVYQNVELGHPELGHRQFVSFGSEQAQLEVDDPPERLPDIGDKINWRYTLEGFYRKEQHDQAD